MSPDDLAFDAWVKSSGIDGDLDLIKRVWLAATVNERRGCARLCFSTWDAMAQGCGKAIKRRASEHNRHTYE